MKSKLSSILKFIIGWPLSLLAFLFILKLIAPQTPTLLTNLRNTNVSLLIYGIVCFICFYLLRGYIWHRLLKGYNYHIPFKVSLSLWATSELKRYIPGNVWSFLGRTVMFAAKGVKKKDMGSFLIIEAQTFILGCVIVSLLAVPFIFTQLLTGIPSFIQYLIYPLVALVLIAYIGHKKIQQKLPPRTHPIIMYLFPQLPLQETVNLLILSTISVFCFGLAYYFTISSFSFINPQLVLAITGFSVLAFVLGYLSFLTPAGFGVREGILILGLNKIMAFNTAGFIALFTRLTLVIAEVLFIAICLVNEKLESPFKKRLDQWTAKNLQLAAVIVAMIVYMLYFTTVSFLRYDNFYTGRFDLGNMAQTVWNTTQGRIFMFTNPNGTEEISRLAFHADVLLVLLAPFYALAPTPKTLLLLQTLITAGGAIIVFKLAQDILKNKNLAAIFSILYLLNPSIQRANLYDFHPVTLATTFLLATFYFYRKKKYIWFCIFALLSALSKEQVWLIIAIFGLCIAFIQKKRMLGIGIAAVCIGLFYYLVWYAIPQTLGTQHFALAYYSDFGDGPTSIIKSILFSPAKTLGTIFEQSRLDYLKQIFLPLGFLSLGTPWFLIFISPDLVINLLSNNPQLHQIYYQYTATISPFLFISALYTVNYLKKFFPKLPLLVIGSYLLLTSLYAAYLFGPLPGAKEANLDMITQPLEDKQLINSYIHSIPDNKSVAASNSIASHFSERQNIYTLPLGIDKADFLLFLLTDSEIPTSLAAQQQEVQKLKHDTHYKLLIEKGTFVVFEKIK
jgi:uncharacterized membrane protein/uncharacterized membrane protein YbhN (UPF0104 family)